ncbi:MAG: DUF362 domain-containing protein [Bacteroidales bacterium]|jgi:hypothetical protein|nr:DUF362 domain-containing protein [Bacteroidales bacterium]
MSKKSEFDINKLKGKPGKAREAIKKMKLPPRFVFLLLGIISTVWFLIRVIPKPTRAAYPCMRVAAPIMSGFVLYLLSLGGITLIFRNTRRGLYKMRFISVFLLIFTVFMSVSSSSGDAGTGYFPDDSEKAGPDDGPNQPVGKATGINPGRVVWAWDPEATNEDCINSFELCKAENTNQEIVSRMVQDAILGLTGKKTLDKAWEALFRSFNDQKHNKERGYRQGEKIFIKINQGTANAKLRKNEIENGFYIPDSMTQSEHAKKGLTGTCETYPNVVLEILRQLVNHAGIDQKNIIIGDPIAHIFGHNYEVWSKEFPGVIYVDRMSDKHGRTIIRPSEDDLIYYSDGRLTDKLYDIVENADYLINIANLKPHGRAGISLTAKNHFGSHGRHSAMHLHASLISPVSLGRPTNNGYHKYRVMVDIMGSKYLGRNTLLFIVDALYGGGSNETKVPVKYFMPPFNNDWCNSVFMSQDQVALESVCYDFLRTEWNGTYSHNPANNAYESIPNVNGVDDHLHQAADPSNWPDGIIYDPDKTGKPLPSLGIHEHWNNYTSKQYSRNLGHDYGIELVAIPDSLVRRQIDI